MSSLDIKRLTVVFHLKEYPSRIVYKTPECEAPRVVDTTLVKQHFLPTQHILIAEKFNGFPGCICRRTTELNIHLSSHRQYHYQ